MEFSFPLNSVLNLIVKEPVWLIVWSAFVVPIGFFIAIIPFGKIAKNRTEGFLHQSIIVLTSTVMLTWILGFIIQLILKFSGVSPIKSALIWVLMFMVYLTFFATNHRMVAKWLDTKKDESKESPN